MKIGISRFCALALLAAAPVVASAQNRAFGQPTFALPQYSSISGPGNAVDGNTDGSYYSGSTYHSATSNNGVWYVDLGSSYDVSQIDFFNRYDCCSSRIIGAQIGVFAAPPVFPVGSNASWSSVFTSAGTMVSATELYQSFNPGGAAGRYVGIYNPSDYLQIAEVRVYGSPSVSAVPEPATIALVGGGLGLIGVLRRRRNVSA